MKVLKILQQNIQVEHVESDLVTNCMTEDTAVNV